MNLYSAIEMENLQPWEKSAYFSFQEKMKSKSNPFPCIPATQGYSLHHICYGFIGDPRDKISIDVLVKLLKEYTEKSKNYGSFTSLVVFFHTKQLNFSIEQYERLFWDILNKLSEKDSEDWPQDIPINPDDSKWEFCFNGERYFVYCATPAHEKRKSRYFPYMMFALTPRWVLEKFYQNKNAAENIKQMIRKRIANYDEVPIHPELKSYGKKDNFEWKQYFLRDNNTSLNQCPFHKKVRDKET
jgi:uncharacterized protein